MRKIDVCLSPELLHLYDIKDRIVVVVDILRATSCMVTALANGVRQIKTYANAEACKQMKQAGYFIAGERNGQKIEGFDLGNSPLSYQDEAFLGENIAVTTTNGTLAIEKSKKAETVVIGAFLNLQALSDYLKTRSENIIILCAGWKGKVNLEDTLFAGALSYSLKEYCEHECDAPLLAETAWLAAKDDLNGYLSNSSHVRRLNKLNIQKDIDFCLNINEFDVIPVLNGEYIVALN